MAFPPHATILTPHTGQCSAVAETSQTSVGIAFWAHIGGFVAGIVTINIFGERPHRYRYGTW